MALREIAPTLPLPPSPVVTRWGSWLNAVQYYATHYHTIIQVIAAFDKNDASCIAVAQSLISKQLFENLNLINNNFGDISIAIKKLEESNLEISKTIDIIDVVSKKINRASPDPITEQVKQKLHSVFHKNIELSVMRGIVNKLKNKQQISQQESYYLHAPLTSCDVERTFSQYKNCLSDRRRKFTFENLRKYFVVYCNAHNENEGDETVHQ